MVSPSQYPQFNHIFKVFLPCKVICLQFPQIRTWPTFADYLFCLPHISIELKNVVHREKKKNNDHISFKKEQERGTILVMLVNKHQTNCKEKMLKLFIDKVNTLLRKSAEQRVGLLRKQIHLINC